MSITSVRIKQELDNSLKILAKKTQRSKSWLINEAIAEYIVKDQIKSQKWLDTLEGLESIRNGEVIDSNEIFDWMKSWGTEKELNPPQVKNED